MVIDTSALICILLDEPKAEHYARCLAEKDFSKTDIISAL
ncbi:type II toxin-antitoxin system VapC family toxin [Allochromatium humboldtianum]|uniref:Type II toxin-antitoxin system VapC family toxin n=1 Tax=Allochromatium humboldtianum TaxID=504901 RepID=A0A850RA60_9GAMM|nr:type II toxin-antitoxin system VapC family toxin [Allochromatium humboldtianum]NVZ10188.1 type II toxin-antitoxin system VapC family toxin [Allochromatium humboldtianum]